jgi:hypothetical protein
VPYKSFGNTSGPQYLIGGNPLNVRERGHGLQGKPAGIRVNGLVHFVLGHQQS